MAKKNYRPNASARKKVEEKRLAEKQAKRLAIWEQYKKQIIIGTVAVVAAIILLVIAVDYFYMPSGSLRTFMGKSMGSDETSIVREMDGHYFELAKMETPEGYEVADYGMQLSNDPQELYRYFETSDANRAVANVYVCGVEKKSGAEMLESLVSSGFYTNHGETVHTEMAGKKVDYLFTQTALTDEYGEETGEHYASLIVYADTIRNSTVLLTMGSNRVALEEVPTEEAMVAEAEQILAYLQLP